MFKKGKLDVISFNYRISTTEGRKFCITCRALIGIVNSVKKHEHNDNVCDLFLNVLNDHKPIFNCFAEKDNLSPKNNFCTKAINQTYKASHYLHERKKFPVADMLSRSFFEEELQLNRVKHKQVLPQVLFETLTRDDEIKLKPVHCFFENETVLPSLKNDCLPGLADFRNDPFPNRNDNEG